MAWQVMIASINAEAEHWVAALAELRAPDDDDGNSIQIYVKHGDSVTPVTISPRAVLPQLKTRVEVQLGVPATSQLLSFRKQPLAGVGMQESFGVMSAAKQVHMHVLPAAVC